VVIDEITTSALWRVATCHRRRARTSRSVRPASGAPTTTGKWITHRRHDAPTGTSSDPVKSWSVIKPASDTAAATQHGPAAHAITPSTGRRSIRTAVRSMGLQQCGSPTPRCSRGHPRPVILLGWRAIRCLCSGAAFLPKNVWLMHDSRVNRLLGDFIQKMVGAERPCTDDAQCPRTDDNQ
jgi:hypothetical protein